MNGLVAGTPEVLAVDDDEVCLAYLQSVLEDIGLQCRVATDGQQALEMIQQQKPRVLLLDLDMPRMRGETLIDYLRNEEKYKDIRIIVISAEEDIEAVAQSIALGADDHIIKPFNQIILNARLQSSLARHRLHELQANEEVRLTELVEERTLEIQKINEQLHSLDHAKNQFLNALSHELLTPLNSLGIVDLLMQEDTFSAEDRQDLYSSYQKAYDRLKKVVDHALILSELTVSSERSTNVPCHPSDMIAMLSEIKVPGFVINSPVFNEFSGSEGFIFGDSKLILQAFGEVIEIAAKFSDHSRNVEIHGNITEGEITISVKSWGYTIPDQYLDKVFEVFSIPDALFPGGGDIGLGPAMAHQVLVTHSGSLKVENHDENGVVFTASVPLAPIPTAGGPAIVNDL